MKLKETYFEPMKTVWLLGAGASVAAGYPVVSNFLQRSYFERWILRESLVGRAEPIAHRMLPQVERWSAEGNDLNAMMTLLLESSDQRRLSELNGFIMDTLYMVWTYLNERHHLPYMASFAQQLGATNSSVISFNYDTLVEEKLAFTHIEWERSRGDEHPTANSPAPIPYTLGIDHELCASFGTKGVCLEFGSGFLPSWLPTEGDIKILKLHGSISILYCAECKGMVYALPPAVAGMPLNGILTAFHEMAAHMDYRCQHCRKGRQFNILFVPPASDTNFPAHKGLDLLWRLALQELEKADILVICGYSLPPEDQRAQGLLRTARITNSNLRVLIVDPFLSDSSRARYLNLFGKPEFMRAEFKHLIGLLASLRTDYRDVLLKSLEGELAEVVSAMVSVEAGRPGGAIKGTIPLEASLDRLVKEGEPLLRSCAIQMLGLSPCTEIQHLLHEYSESGIDELQRGLCAWAMGSFGNQAAVDSLSALVNQTSPLKGSIPWSMRSIATYAMDGLLEAALTSPQLDFRNAIELIGNGLSNGSYSWLDGQFAYRTVQLLRNACQLR